MTSTTQTNGQERTAGKKIAWGLTGAGDRMEETLTVMRSLKKDGWEIDVFLSAEALTVLKWYGFADAFFEDFPNAKTEKGPNAPFIVGPLQRGEDHALVVCPATANTVAKIVCGIADTLLTNAVAQTAKSATPIYILPVDAVPGTVHTRAPNGREFDLTMRQVDIENAEKLGRMENITLLKDPEDAGYIFSAQP